MTTAMRSPEGVLDPWVAEWLAANGAMMEPPAEYTPEYLAAARPSTCPFPTREVAKVTDDMVGGVWVRIYEPDHTPTGLVVYIHGGAFCVGSVGLMELIATELAHCAGAAVVSVEYRLAPEHPYPAGLDDCEAVTRWVLTNASRFGVPPTGVVVAGESAGGNLAAAVSLRLRADAGSGLAGQVLLYPVLDPPSAEHPSRTQFDGPMLRTKSIDTVWAMYSGGRELDRDPFAVPLQAESLTGLPPALVVVGGCDLLRDEGRQYVRRLREDGVAAEEVCFAGQPHGFMNLGFPAASEAYARIGPWLQARFAAR
jgi:acetyl esterase